MDNSTPYRAIEYDAKVRQTLPYYDTIHTQVIRLVKLIKLDAKCWVDTGCGTGHLVQQAWPLFPETQFVLADPSAMMLEQTRARLSGVKQGKFKLIPPCGSADLSNYISETSVDVVTAIQCHHYLREPERLRALRACCGLLNQGGLLVTFENIAPRTAEGLRYGLASWKDFLLLHGKTGEEADRHLARYNTEFFPITVEQHLQVLGEAGFNAVEVFWYSHMQAGFYAIK